MLRLQNLTLILPMLLAGCATAPSVLVKAICPQIPELDQVPAAQVPSFTDRMQQLLSGKLPEQTDYSLTSPNVKISMPRPEKP